MKRLIAAVSVAVAGMSATPLVVAETAVAPAAKKPAKKAPVKHKAVEAKPGVLLDEDGKVFSAGSDLATDVNCELGAKLTLYRNAGDADHMALRWQQRVHRMTRVSTSTGADRFENSRHGLVWIGIPAKGMLLDSKRGQQLANECKDAGQMVVKAVMPPAPATPAVTPAEAPAVTPAGVSAESPTITPAVTPSVTPAGIPAAAPAAGPAAVPASTPSAPAGTPNLVAPSAASGKSS